MKTRVAEWLKLQKYNAGVVLSKREVDELVAGGVTRRDNSTNAVG